MVEPWEHLRVALDELEQELRSTEDLDPRVREHLQKAADELRAAVQESQPGNRLSAQAGTARSLRDAIERFEISHPTLTGILGRMIDALAQLGI